jgi:hypothetical protein
MCAALADHITEYECVLAAELLIHMDPCMHSTHVAFRHSISHS